MQNMAADMTQVMGIGGYVGEIRQGPDGQLYEWVEGVDGLGNPVGFWRGARRFFRRVGRGLKKVGRFVRPFARFALPFTKFIPGVGPAIYAAGTVAQRAGILGTGQVAQGPDGQLYEYVEGVDGLGNPVGFWSPLRRLTGGLLRRVPGLQRVRGAARQFCQALPQFEPCVRQVPAAQPAYRTAGQVCSVLRRVGLAEAPDGQLYEYVEGVDGLGNPVGFWRGLRRVAGGLARRVRGAIRRGLPGVVSTIARRIPGVGRIRRYTQPFCQALPQFGPCIQQVPALQRPYRVATQVCNVLRSAGLAEAPDGQLYEVIEGVGAFGQPMTLIRPAYTHPAGQY